MKHSFETREIKDISLHPDNVRAMSQSGYGEAEIAPLATNIAECGLLQPLLVAALPKGSDTLWGVLAAGAVWRHLSRLRRTSRPRASR